MKRDGRRPLVPRSAAGLCLVAALLATVAGLGSTQEESDSVFAPFVSRIRISTRDPEVRLTWQDSRDVDGGYRIYRHTSEITAETFLSATLVGSVDQGVQSFIDAPEAPGEYFYAIIAESADDQTYEIFIPYRNTTERPVRIANIATVEDQSAHVRSIEAVVSEGSVVLRYESDQVGRNLVVFRSTKPLADVEDLATVGIVTTVDSTVESVTDFPVPGVPYYYGIVDSALVAEGSAVFEDGQNATTVPVEIPLIVAEVPETREEPLHAPEDPEPEPATEEVVPPPGPAIAPPETPTPDAAPDQSHEDFTPVVVRRRPLPLPFLQLTSDLETGSGTGDSSVVVPVRRAVSRETQSAVDAMLARLVVAETLDRSPQILPDDTLPSPTGAEFTLRTILDGPFSRMAWDEALSQLNNFLSLPLSEEVRARAIFYRAQCYYFTGETRRAFMEFLLVRDTHHAAATQWLDAVLSSSSGT